MPIMAYNLLPILVGISLIIGTYSGYPVAFVLGGLDVFLLLVGGVPGSTLQLAVSRSFVVMADWLLPWRFSVSSSQHRPVLWRPPAPWVSSNRYRS